MMIATIFETKLVPLTHHQDGSIRIGETRVLLDLVIHAYNEGRIPEEIVISFPTLRLSDVYAVIAYYLDHPQQIDAYIATREQEAEQLWTRIESDPTHQALRQRLLRRSVERH